MSKLKNRNSILAIATLLTFAIFIIVGIVFNDNAEKSKITAKAAKSIINGDILIKTDEVSEKARFIPAIIDGTKLEVIAVKANDGTIRTAFNTCQVCYSSGRGYYKQVGDELVCQNCGNTFKMDEVQVTKGGCNPVPIDSENKTSTSTQITIPYAYMSKMITIFANWKS